MDQFSDWVMGLNDRLRGWTRRRVEYQGDPESMVGAFIVTVWTVLASIWAGWPIVLVMLAIMWVLHGAAVESGSHVLLWIATSALLIAIVVASQVIFNGLPPVLLALAGATALGHNELIRLNYSRRRNSIVHDGVFQSSGIAVAAAAAVGAFGIGLAQLAAGGGQRNWLWMPAAVGILMVIGFALAVAPTHRAGKAKIDRWQPGQRIPPQPLGKEDLEQF